MSMENERKFTGYSKYNIIVEGGLSSVECTYDIINKIQ